MRAWAIVMLLAGCGLLCSGAGARTRAYAPLNHPGPALSVPAQRLRAALSCTPGYAGRRITPVLLIPGTNLDPGVNYRWNYERAFAAQGRPYCGLTLPYHTMGDIQTAGEYVVYALRTMARAAHRRIDVLGYSQGGMLPRWALRFWPDTRRLVADFVALDPSNHGTVTADAACSGSCPIADRQQEDRAAFIAALNSRTETFAGIDYTVVYSADDEIVVPNSDSSGSSSLHTGAGRIANIRVQDICPDDTSDHLAMGSYDAVGYALTLDAFTHPGPASAARIPASVCAESFQPGVDPLTFPSDYGAYLTEIGQAQQTAPTSRTEPPLRCYVFAACSRPRKPRRR